MMVMGPASIVASQIDDLKIMQAARRKPLKVRLMECILGVAVGVAFACLIAMLVQGFTLYAGYHVPGVMEWWPWRTV